MAVPLYPYSYYTGSGRDCHLKITPRGDFRHSTNPAGTAYNQIIMENGKNSMRLLSFVPLILMMCIIWSFSSRDAEGSSQMSGSTGAMVVHAANRMFRVEMTESEVSALAEHLQPVVRKTAHVAEYFLLALTATLPLFAYGKISGRFFLLAGVFCVLYAATDELHQSFVPGRSAQIRDVLIDGAGVAAGILLARLHRRPPA